MCNFLLSSVPLCKTQALMPFSIPAKKKKEVLSSGLCSLMAARVFDLSYRASFWALALVALKLCSVPYLLKPGFSDFRSELFDHTLVLPSCSHVALFIKPDNHILSKIN
jgi:hypothetical protein